MEEKSFCLCFSKTSANAKPDEMEENEKYMKRYEDI